MSERSRLGDLLVDAGVVQEFQLAAALEEQKRCDRPLGMTLVRMGLIEEETLIRHLSGQLGLPMARLNGKRIAEEVLDLVPLEVADKHRCFPLFVKGAGSEKRLFVAVEDPFDSELIAFLERSTGLAIQRVLVPPSEIEEAVHRHHDLRSPAAPLVSAPLGAIPREGGGESSPGPLPAPDAHFAGPIRSDDDSLDRASSALFAQAESAVEEERVGSVPTSAILRALAQLLVEKGLVTREELAERIQAVASSDDPT